jgi:hypothetical protein
LVAFGALGMLWSDAAWPERFSAFGRFAKLLAIPLLLCHFRHSDRARWVLATFLASCTAVLMASYIHAVVPFLGHGERGVPVKNSIAQSQEFAFCIAALVLLATQFLRDNRRPAAIGAVALALVFLLDMLFIVSSRTALVSLAVLFVVLCAWRLSWRGAAVAAIAALVVVGSVWIASPYLRGRTTQLVTDIQRYQDDGTFFSSGGQRLEFWRRSLGFVEQAPVIGHGTGSIRGLFERALANTTDREKFFGIVANPHNQTLAVAIQLGLVGVLLLYAMWFVHLRTFATGQGFAAWIGFAAVVQNFTSSVANSHLFDSVEGWIYVLAVGAAAGALLKEQRMPDAIGNAGGAPAFRLSAGDSKGVA